jgi:hypothetical protein
MVNSLGFTEKHMLFIQQYINGVFFNTIKKNLNIKTDEEIISLKEEIKNKLLVVSDLEMIQKACDLELVLIDDFLLKNWRDIAFKTAYNVYIYETNNYLERPDLKLIYIKVLRIYVMIFKELRYRLN